MADALSFLSDRCSRPLSAAVVVAHPDDEILWTGGQILAHPDWNWFIASLCRGDDPDRAPRFERVLEQMGAEGGMGRLDDGPTQEPLTDGEVENAILSLMPRKPHDVVFTHGPKGEYTRHRRHEEVCRAVVRLWETARLETNTLLLFAYKDGAGRHLPRADRGAPVRERLGKERWERKHAIIVETYGFEETSWEARTTTREEAFWCFHSPKDANSWIAARRAEP